MLLSLNMRPILRRLPKVFTRPTAILAALGLLSACAPFTPFAVEISDQSQFTSDLSTCQGYATLYHPGINPLDLASSGALGAIQNAPAGAVNPLIPVIGALGGTTTAAINGLDLLSTNQRKIVTLCMAAKGDKSGKYLVIDPNR